MLSYNSPEIKHFIFYGLIKKAVKFKNFICRNFRSFNWLKDYSTAFKRILETKDFSRPVVTLFLLMASSESSC